MAHAMCDTWYNMWAGVTCPTTTLRNGPMQSHALPRTVEFGALAGDSERDKQLGSATDSHRTGDGRNSALSAT